MLQAAEFPPGSYERLIHVACFAVSGYAATAKRASKPFNPLLGETYEFVCPEKGFRFISEKVWTLSHGVLSSCILRQAVRAGMAGLSHSLSLPLEAALCRA